MIIYFSKKLNACSLIDTWCYSVVGNLSFSRKKIAETPDAAVSSNFVRVCVCGKFRPVFEQEPVAEMGIMVCETSVHTTKTIINVK